MIKYTITESGVLLLQADEQARSLLAFMKEHDRSWGSCSMETDVLGPLISNSSLSWIRPEDTGDLTDAPMLGFLGSDDEITGTKVGPHGAVLVGHWDGSNKYVPIIQRWAFMDYQIKSFLDDLLEKGEARFIR